MQYIGIPFPHVRGDANELNDVDITRSGFA
jgi:hypothetical protein